MSKNYSSFEFGLSVEGSYQQLTDFMDNLVNFQRIITIADISISKLNSAESNGALQLNLKGAALFKE
jgi:Tfp pilus assembly protein PilO